MIDDFLDDDLAGLVMRLRDGGTLRLVRPFSRYPDPWDRRVPRGIPIPRVTGRAIPHHTPPTWRELERIERYRYEYL